MVSLRRRSLLAALASASTLGLDQNAAAQSGPWPNRPIKVVVNFPPASSPDVIARAIAAPLQEQLGQPVVVENKSGAAGSIGADFVAKSKADGYTVLMSAGSTIAIDPFIYANLPFNWTTDLIPVAGVSRMTLFLVAKPGLPPKSLTEFIAYLKDNPGKLSYGSAGGGTGLHLAAEMMNAQAGVSTLHVPYKGASPALQALLAGQIDFYFDPGIATAFVRAGKLKVLGVGGPKRSALYPDVPTFDEVGFKDFDAGTTHGFYLPAGTPPDIVKRLNLEINRTLATPAVRELIGSLGAEATALSPEGFRAVLNTDSKRYGAIVKERGIQRD